MTTARPPRHAERVGRCAGCADTRPTGGERARSNRRRPHVRRSHSRRRTVDTRGRTEQAGHPGFCFRTSGTQRSPIGTKPRARRCACTDRRRPVAGAGRPLTYLNPSGRRRTGRTPTPSTLPRQRWGRSAFEPTPIRLHRIQGRCRPVRPPTGRPAAATYPACSAPTTLRRLATQVRRRCGWSFGRRSGCRPRAAGQSGAHPSTRAGRNSSAAKQARRSARWRSDAVAPRPAPRRFGRHCASSPVSARSAGRATSKELARRPHNGAGGARRQPTTKPARHKVMIRRSLPGHVACRFRRHCTSQPVSTRSAG